MKTATYHFKGIVILFIACLILSACKKDKNIKASIVGTWINSIAYAKAQQYKQTYVFNADSTVNITQAVVDSASGNVLGYMYSGSGKFRLNADEITFYNLASYRDTVTNSTYLPLNKLALIKTDTLENYNIIMADDMNSFHFIYYCLLTNAGCPIKQIIFTRQ